MATRFYLPASAEATGISPTPDAAWEDVSNLARAVLRTTPIADAMADVSSPDDADNTDKDILFRQYVSDELTVGQKISELQVIKAQCRLTEPDGSHNLFFTVGIRVIASDGTTVRATILAVTRDNVEVAQPDILTNRQFTATSAATDYYSVSGDRLVVEIGMGGDPGGAGVHQGTMRLGDDAASDLSEDDTSTSDDRPWIQMADNISFSESDGDGLDMPWTTMISSNATPPSMGHYGVSSY